MGFQFYPFKTSQVAVTGTATQIVAANAARSGISIENLGTTDVWLGENSAVTTSTGHLLLGTKGASVSFSTTGAVWGITSGASQSVSVLETQ
jgi:hypothetical protein